MQEDENNHKKPQKSLKKFAGFKKMRTFASAFDKNALRLNNWCGSSAG